MAYRNQNYMTNKLIKEAVDKNQKDYKPDDEEPNGVAETRGSKEPEEYAVTIEVSDNNGLLDEAIVKLGDERGETDSSGIVDFYVTAGKYNLQISKDGYVTKKDTITVSDHEIFVYQIKKESWLGEEDEL